MYIMSDCLCFASQTQLEVILFKNIEYLYIGQTLFTFNDMTMEQTLEKFAEEIAYPNTIVISARREKSYSYFFGSNTQQKSFVEAQSFDQDELQSDNDDEAAEVTTDARADQIEQVTFQFVVLPHSISSIQDSADVSIASVLPGNFQQFVVNKNVDKHDSQLPQTNIGLNQV